MEVRGNERRNFCLTFTDRHLTHNKYSCTGCIWQKMHFCAKKACMFPSHHKPVLPVCFKANFNKDCYHISESSSYICEIWLDSSEVSDVKHSVIHPKYHNLKMVVFSSNGVQNRGGSNKHIQVRVDADLIWCQGCDVMNINYKTNALNWFCDVCRKKNNIMRILTFKWMFHTSSIKLILLLLSWNKAVGCVMFQWYPVQIHMQH